MTRMEGLVDALLTVSAIQSKTLRLRREYIDLVALCRGSATDESSVHHRAVTLELPDAPVTAFVDRRRIAEVVQHLVRNALMYSPQDKSVIVRLHEEGREAVIEVHDSGPGIPIDEVSRIFDRFYRVAGIGVQVGSRIGFGLGLYVVKGLVEQHGGRSQSRRARGAGAPSPCTCRSTSRGMITAARHSGGEIAESTIA